ncbi:phospholipase C/P1 nuclease [Bradyrhizobium oligotrophicum S58]|uniref:Phospholipase C/P1 nuclease n=1 Tax=Bradyrhizobium oligotrophicum S58 TaxID=1245469 RepID=M4ZAT5_9BRAD|nr:S1/P1 nuclease [Bradyrhizobium oligotrophicum]BAM90752.1 phospholipase C/P1 nuclease [Bradyrhizobium oligotrophicum S58]
MRRLAIAFVVALVSPAAPALAWWDEGHMQIAYVAYKKLTPAARDRADALLKLNPDYANWIAGAPQGQEQLYAFVHAATWPDDIKMKPDYYDDQVTDSTAKQLVPYGHLKHAYWHYKDALFSADDTPLPRPDSVDAVSQLKLMIAKLPANSDASETLRSYSLSWMIHLVGDLHQPLHAIARYSAALPDKGGDRGGNEEQVVAANGETLALHAYWDGIFGGYSTVFGAVFDADQRGGLSSVTADAAKAQIIDPATWAQESFDLAKTTAYAAPVRTDKQPAELTREYETNARETARKQAALAAARLANLLEVLLR